MIQKADAIHYYNSGPFGLSSDVLKAAAIYRFLVENGWEKTLVKYRPKAAKPAEPLPREATVGDFIGAVGRNHRIATVAPI